MKDAVLDSFDEVRDGYSVDRVIVDPELNARFISACRRRGLKDREVELNLILLNARKRGGLPRGSRRTVVRNQDAYRFAAEIAIRSIERKHRTTLDRVLCDPVLAIEFDGVAVLIAPGFTPMEYRWAALGLRKKSRLKPEILGRAVPTEVIGPLTVAGIDRSTIPIQQGLYVLASCDRVLYIGEAKNLRGRLKKHLDHSDNKSLARHFWTVGDSDLWLELHVLPSATRTDVRRALETELIRSRNPEFNVRR